MKYLNTLITVVNLAQKNIENRNKGVANASDYLETWEDSDNIMVVVAEKGLGHPENGGITT